MKVDKRNWLCGRPLILGDPEQVRALQSFEIPEELHPYDVHGVKSAWRCIRCHSMNRFKTRYMASEEQWITITPWVHYCSCCQQSMILYKDSQEFGGAYYMRFLKVNEDIDALKYRDEDDGWKYYEHFNLVK